MYFKDYKIYQNNNICDNIKILKKTYNLKF